MVDPHDDSIVLISSRYDRWREAYARERDRLRIVFEERGTSGGLDRIEHVGSTAVPDPPARNIVDLDVVVSDDAVRAVSRAIEADLGGTG
ncbi:GrpB family protein [Natronorarus salvus]|uniref:GrpB family protein n=1 Tax=Natronorarus salvus TaxID=3117733 RepID=UPI002F261B24